MKGSYTGKAPGSKLLRVALEWEGQTVKSITIKGDFFAHPEQGFEEAEASLAGKPLSGLGDIFKKELEDRSVELFGLSPLDLDVALAAILSGV